LWEDGERDAQWLAAILVDWPADNSPGNQLSLVSFLLMAVDPTAYPVFRARPVETALGLLDVQQPDVPAGEIDLEREYAPEDLAVRLGVSAKRIRAFLRSEFPRPKEEHGRRYWALPEEQVSAVVARFGRNVDAAALNTAIRYFTFLVDILDELIRRLGERGVRLRDRLDAQGLAWWITNGDPPDEWSEAEKAAFLAYRGSDPPPPPPLPLADNVIPAATTGLAERLLLPQPWLQEIVDLLNEKRQVIFYGPPGTGKTYVAQAFGEHVSSASGAYELVQFHPAYSYEDFFEGFRPAATTAGVGVAFELRHGPLRRIAARAVADPEHPYLLIVDEINRGNVAKIFGELFFLLEYRDRAIPLQYSPDEPFALPSNLYIVGTMNTADRSIALVDTALRRRFYFVPFMPTKAPLNDVLRKWLERERLDTEPAVLLERLNAAIGADEFAIGPSYFMGARGANGVDLERVWRFSIKPLLEEHYYGTGRSVDDFGFDALRTRAQPVELPPAEPAADEVDGE